MLLTYIILDTSEDYCKYYETLQNNDGLFISHIIYSMLLDKNIFRPIMIDEYIDFECG